MAQATAIIAPSTVSAEATAVSLLTPVYDAHEGLFLFGTAAGPIGKNLAPGKAAATVVGAPVLGARYATMVGGSAYLNTNIASPGDFTGYAIVQLLASDMTTNVNKLQIISSASGLRVSDTTKNSGGVSLAYAGAGQGTGSAAVYAQGAYIGTDANASTTQNGVYLSIATPLTFKFLCIRRSGLAVTVRDLTSATTATTTAGSGSVQDIANTTLYVGSAPSSLFGTGNIAMAEVFSRAHTDTEITTMYSFWKTFFANNNRGIAI